MNTSRERILLAEALQSALASAVIKKAESPPIIVAQPGKPISFAPELVAAILAGRKTQTRRLVRPLPGRTPPGATCPIAQPGGRLYVREPWAMLEGRYVFAADGAFGVPAYRPAMFMPRAAARLFLHVTSVHSERLQALTPAAARAEGAPVGHADAAAWFQGLWTRLFTAAGERWADDPLVWVITFEIAQHRK